MESTIWMKTCEIHRRLRVLMKHKGYAINSLKNAGMFYYERNETMFLNVEHGKYNYRQIII